MGSPLSSGTKLGRYEISSRLGEGGMGEVYLAYDTQLDRAVALKILPENVAADQTRLKRFFQEAKSASALNHPNILTVYEIGQVASNHFIASEYIEGETLRDHLSNARMTLNEVLDICIQGTNALAAAHKAGIIHRDMKPENIMIRRDGIVKVLDFGLAKLTAHESAVVDTQAPTKAILKTDPGTVVGTAIYMSPEQARGIPVDQRTDIFSMGVVLYEMVAGCLPFAGSTSSEVLASILSEKEPQPLARYSREVPAELERIVSKALRKKREERYQTIKDFLLDLKSLKQELEFAAKLERSTPPELSGAGGASKRTHPEPASTGPGDTGQTAVEGPRATLNADLIVRRIKRHRVGTLLALVTLGAVAAAVVYLAYSRKAGEGGSGAIQSIAVLPFTNADGNPDAEYLSDGISESLINSLSQLPGIKVIARSSSFAYKGKEAEPQEVAKALGVEAILTGRVMQRGDNLLISAELVNASDMTHVWGGQYRRQAADALAVQEEIAREISEKLQVKLTAQEQERLVKRHTENIEAYEAYLKGRYFWSKRTVEDFKKSIEYFRQAIEKDPGYALAYTGLADSYILLGTYHVLPPAEAIPKARLAAMKALEIDDELAEAHISLATIEGELEWNWSIAEKEFKQAIKLNPNYATAHQWYGEYLVVMGRFDEALAEIKRAHQLDPLSLVVNLALGDVFYYSRRYDEAIEQYRKTVEIDSDFAYAYAWLGRAYLQKGLYAKAIAKLEKARELSGGEPLIVAWLGYALALAGEKDKARDMLDELKERSKREYISPYYLAIIYAGLADKDQAFEYLEKAYAERSNWVPRLKAEPKFDSLRSDQKFADLLRRVGLPQ